MSADQIRERLLFWDKAQRRYVDAHNGLSAPKLGEKFLKGPIPWTWIIRATGLPGRALEVGLCLWRLVGATTKSTVPLCNSELTALGIDRHAKARALYELEKVGLISVERSGKKVPRVTVLKC